MAADTYNILFDSGIEKVLQGTSSTTLTHEITVSGNGNSDSSYGFYLKPVFKSGYELNSATGTGDGWQGDVYFMGGGSNVTFTSKQSATRISVDLATAFPDKWAALSIGKHTLQIRAKNPGNYLDSDLSTAIEFYKTCSITVTATHCTAAASNPTAFPDVNGGDTILAFNKVTGYTLPETIVITGVAGLGTGYTWTVASDGQSAQLKILKALGDITVKVEGTVETYNITVNATNASKASGPSTINYGGSATLTFTYDDGYFTPASITEITGATGSWNQSTSTLTLTNCTGPVTVTIKGAVKTYSITPAITNCTWNGKNPTTIASNQFTPIELNIIKNVGWTLPTEISVSGVDAEYWTWNQATGTVTISHPQGNVTITVNAVREVYNITTNLTNALAGTSNPTTIGYGLSATLTFTFPTGYEAPADVTVTGATKSWASGTGTLTLTNATGNVTVTVVGVATTTTLDGGTYKWHDSINLTEWTQDINFTSDGTSYKAMRYTGDGTAMTLQYEDADSEWTTVYNYNEDTSTGSWVNDNYKIVDLGTSAQTVTAIFKADFIANTTKLTQLATPQNVTADGTNVSWDEVENATSYEVIEGGNNVLGTVTPSYKVTLTVSERDISKRQSFEVYDGELSQGKLLYKKTGTTGNVESPQILSISSGILYIYAHGVHVEISALSKTGGVSGGPTQYTVIADGTLSIDVGYDD